MAAACSWHVDSLFRSTSMKLLLVSGIGLTPDLQLGTRHSRAVAAHAVETAVSAMREREVFLGRATPPSLFFVSYLLRLVRPRPPCRCKLQRTKVWRGENIGQTVEDLD